VIRPAATFGRITSSSSRRARNTTGAPATEVFLAAQRGATP